MKYRFKTKPYRHQVKALKKLLENGWGGALLMEPRTGKTKVAIDYACILHQAGKVSRVVVICPISVIGVWIRELETHATVKYKVTIWDKKGRKQTPLPPFGRDVLDFVFINYEAFQLPGIKTPNRAGTAMVERRRGGRWAVRKTVRDWQPQLIIADEMHRIKRASGKRSTTIQSLVWVQNRTTLKWRCMVPYRVGMTGTVVTGKKKIFDIFGQWKFLNRKSPLVKDHTLDTFKQEYGKWLNRGTYNKWLRNQNTVKLRELLHEESFSITRAECYDLPARLPDEIIDVELEESADAYREMAEEMIARLKSGEITEASIPLVQAMRLAQITSGLARTSPTREHPEGRLVRIGKEKLRILEDRTSDLFEADQKLVIAARWVGDLASISAMCKRMGVESFELHGRIKSRVQRDQNIEAFRKHPGPAAFIMQPAAGALGIDLSTASTMIWFSLTNSFVDFSQSEDRIALSPVARSYIYLVAKDTVDWPMYLSLQEDGDLVRLIQKRPELLLGPSLRKVDARSSR